MQHCNCNREKSNGTVKMTRWNTFWNSPISRKMNHERKSLSIKKNLTEDTRGPKSCYRFPSFNHSSTTLLMKRSPLRGAYTAGAGGVLEPQIGIFLLHYIYLIDVYKLIKFKKYFNIYIIWFVYTTHWKYLCTPLPLQLYA